MEWKWTRIIQMFVWSLFSNFWPMRNVKPSSFTSFKAAFAVISPLQCMFRNSSFSSLPPYPSFAIENIYLNQCWISFSSSGVRLLACTSFFEYGYGCSVTNTKFRIEFVHNSCTSAQWNPRRDRSLLTVSRMVLRIDAECGDSILLFH